MSEQEEIEQMLHTIKEQYERGLITQLSYEKVVQRAEERLSKLEGAETPVIQAQTPSEPQPQAPPTTPSSEEIQQPTPEETAKRDIFPTGIDLLDEVLEGGIPNGSVICLMINPNAVLAEVLLHYLASIRRTYYIATDMRCEDIKRNMEKLQLRTDRITFIGDEEARYSMHHTLNSIKEEDQVDVNIVINTFSFFMDAIDHDNLRKMIQKVSETAVCTNGIAYLYVYKGTHSKELENLIFNSSDIVFDIDFQESSEGVPPKSTETLLSVNKARGMMPAKKAILLDRVFTI